MNVILTGTPRTGKTTIIHKIISKINKECAGFYTEEIKEKSRRMGFSLITLDNKTCILSHRHIKSRYRVGRYGVNLDCIEKIGVPAIRKGIEQNKIVIIDEIGKMEFYSKEFKDIVIKALDSNCKVLGTILSRPHPFCDRIKHRNDVEIIEVTEENRDSLPAMIVKVIT
ncbi:NTPase [candidate division WOR-3 bacterium]|nr:NTPase [candidate division WOR-3 bacterium]